MLPYRRRHQYIIGTERRRSRFIGRAIIGLVALLIAWYLASRVSALFDHSVGKRAATILSVRSGLEGAQVSLQGGDWQRPETSLKLYPGDSVALRGNTDLVLTFFDGTRVRLDQGGEVTIEHSDSYGQQGNSRIELTVKTGRVWINTPTVLAYSGSITRTVIMQPYKADIPASTNALLSPTEITVLRAAGIGLKTTLSFAKTGNNEVYVGEGQHLNTGDDARREIGGGRDPYDFRDPILAQFLKDEFLLSSYSLFSTSPTPVEQSAADAGTSLAGSDENLILTSPENAASITNRTVVVSGNVSPRIALLLVNGQSVPIRKDLSFSVDVSLSKDPTTRIRVEAQDAQGLILGQAERSVQNAYKPVVQPARIKSPVGSGETLTTALREIEITGEAPQGTAGIIVNDYRLQLFKPGDKTWSYLASVALGNLVAGSNAFTVYAVDADGNKSEPRSITIVLQENGATASGEVVQPPIKQNLPLTPGVLTVEAPLAGMNITTAEKEVVIEGRTSAETYSISVNGYTLSLYQPGKTTWNYIASTELRTMKRGKNVYRIVARNKDGEILDILEYTITFKP